MLGEVCRALRKSQKKRDLAFTGYAGKQKSSAAYKNHWAAAKTKASSCYLLPQEHGPAH
jgi:hypothetical protein